ncbi:hypothetical protein [Novipirellula artificiosorum]|uniref:Uncharacterized protein n=1 Tax=Novipirellula artificiosorum TaxID=2528016 RepID=A0A5C6DR02_9BACT|nr:hypothetical protein [Novipirellula artificiosorum]TWU38307.1 hypothetical protein Poly41_27830 [Novipirellula artificiosorum]
MTQRLRFRTSIVLSCFVATNALAHEGHDHPHEAASAPQQMVATAAGPEANSFVADGVTYQWKHRPDLGLQPEAMVAAAKPGLHNNADEDPETGEVVTVVANYGLVKLDQQMKSWSLVDDQDPHFAGGMNSHGMDCFTIDGEVYYASASTNTQEVVVSKRGKVIARLESPKGTEFDNPGVNAYYKSGGRFVPCDVVWVPTAKRLLVVTGYSNGDFAISARRVDGAWKWDGVAFGGRIQQGGPFLTGHGIELKITEDGIETVQIASRGHGRLYGFTPNGAMINLNATEGQYYAQLHNAARPCNLDFQGDLTFVPLLDSLPSTNGVAPVMVLKNFESTGSLIPAEFDDLQFMRHMHGLKTVRRDRKLFAITLSWRNGGENGQGKLNDGQIAIFEAVATQ